MKWCIAGLALVVGLIGQVAVHAQTGVDAGDRVTPIKALIDDNTIAVLHIDLSKVDPAAAGKFVEEAMPKGALGPNELAQMNASLGMASGVRSKLLESGLTDWYGVVRLDPAAAQNPNAPPMVAAVVPVQGGKDAKAAAAALQGLIGLPPTVQGQSLVLMAPGTESAWQAVRPKQRDEFVAAFQAAGNTAAQLVFVPNDALRQMQGGVPPQLQAAAPAIQGLAQKLQWTAVTLNAPPAPALALILQMEDKESAEMIQSGIKMGLAMAAQQPQVKESVPNIAQLSELLTPKLRGDTQLRIVLSDKNGGIKAVTDTLAAGAMAARKAAQGMQGANNMKQLALAMHNYHDRYQSFPAQATKSADGKKLLSWRVQLLPYLGEDALYNQFHHNEPWDSEHNKALVARMPQVFASPTLPEDLKAKGMTLYVAPVAKGTIWGDDAGAKISGIVDGTSNTVMLVEALPAKAVIWSKPDDLTIEEANPLQGLVAMPTDKFYAAFCDGAVRAIVGTIDKRVAWFLFLKDDGNPIQGF